MKCDCIGRFSDMAESRRIEASRLLERELPARLEAFADAMRLGAVQLVARQLLRAGVYRVSLDLEGSRKVSSSAIIDAVKRLILTRPKLESFAQTQWSALIGQVDYVNPDDILPHRIQKRDKLKETYGGYIDSSLDAAERLLERLKALEGRLPVWKSFARGADVPRVEPIMDYHDSEK